MQHLGHDIGQEPAQLVRLAQAAGHAASPQANGQVPKGPAAALSGGTLSGGTARGEFRFVTADEREAACLQLARDGVLVATLEGIGPSVRGRLAEALYEAIEQELASRSAPGPGLNTPDNLDSALSDQLFRARQAGASGIAAVLGPLHCLTGEDCALHPADCRALRLLAMSTLDRPLVVLLDALDARMLAYGDPLPLIDLLCPRPATEALPQPVKAWPATHVEPIERHTAGASVVSADEGWRAWTLQLSAARGPQSLASLERLFSESYVPLANAVTAGLEDPRARAARDEFRVTFSKAYSDAFATFAVTSKRPRMVFDAHELAARIARLHGARSSRLLLVDSMRWDLGRLVEQRLVARLGTRATITDELVLWSALPTTTARQLETIARGVEALRSPSVFDPDSDSEAFRGRTAEYVRRLRVGPRELHKLDVVSARLSALRTRCWPEALESLADSTADIVARHIESLAPRTLLFFFGDHGFVLNEQGAAAHGGASPEEVLVGAFALLVGDVH
jgi:hypothetical protein